MQNKGCVPEGGLQYFTVNFTVFEGLFFLSFSLSFFVGLFLSTFLMQTRRVGVKSSALFFQILCLILLKPL